MVKYKLYWIHTADMKDPKTEGYIGLTGRNINERLNEHIERKNWPKNINITLLETGDKSTISNLEREYRPKSYIGWNKSPGGITGGRPTGIHTSGWKHSKESRLKRRKNFSGKNNPMYGKKQTTKQREAASKANSIKKPYASIIMKKRAALGLIPTWGTGKDNHRARGVIIEGKVYDTLNDAAIDTGIHRTTIAHRCKSKNQKYAGYTRT